jgi:hypothetical protein
MSYAQMQMRLIDLLLRYDHATFRARVGEYTDYAPAPASIQHYRDLAVLFHLRDELFGHIVPRIVRRLSFETPAMAQVEVPPVHGFIDWERTLHAAWNERPDEPPLELHTRQRRRDFATPENVLLVATLLEYRAAVQRVLWESGAFAETEALRHPLNEIVQQCERALAFPQFAALRPLAQRLVDGDAGGSATLEVAVRERAVPGGNSAYVELVRWRERLAALRLLAPRPATGSAATVGADPAHQDTLYQCWLFYEVVDVLHQRGKVVELETVGEYRCVRFWWGAGETRCCYELYSGPYNPLAWQRPHPPAVSPDLSLWRVEPPPASVYQQGVYHWHEPGIVWGAAFAYGAGRVLAALAATGEPYGVLLYADSDGEDTPPPAPQSPDGAWQVAQWQVAPLGPHRVEQTHARLAEILDAGHALLHTPRVPCCHGVFLDTLSAAERGGLVDRAGLALEGDASDWLICPKPHVGPQRVDLVSRRYHCCQEGALCHIIGKPGCRPPLRPPRTIDDVVREVQSIVMQIGDEEAEPDEELVSSVARQIEQITRSFAELAGAYRHIEIYYLRLRDLGMERTLHRLDDPERQSLALALFLVDQLDSVGAHDYSAPVIHISSVMEAEVQRTIFRCLDTVPEGEKPKKRTLGVLPWMRRRREEVGGAWEVVERCAADHWDGHIDPDQPELEVTFADFVTRALSYAAMVRNRAAHHYLLSRKEYSELQRAMFQGGPVGYGALNVLLLAWQYPEAKEALAETGTNPITPTSHQ